MERCGDCGRGSTKQVQLFNIDVFYMCYCRIQNASECGRKGGTRQNKKLIHNDNDDIRVVGGTEARENEIPWHVAMLRKNDGWHGCGAALLSCDPLIVVTAAHCVE